MQNRGRRLRKFLPYNTIRCKADRDITDSRHNDLFTFLSTAAGEPKQAPEKKQVLPGQHIQVSSIIACPIFVVTVLHTKNWRHWKAWEQGYFLMGTLVPSSATGITSLTLRWYNHHSSSCTTVTCLGITQCHRQLWWHRCTYM